MKYKKPVCECGNELVYICDVKYTQWFKINMNGRVRKKPYIEHQIHTDAFFECLWCSKCNCEYDYELLDGKMYRGDRHESS